MIIWINGAFGAGKTSVAEGLVDRLPSAMVFDPEVVGAFVRHVAPDASDFDDFQDMDIWRTMVVAAAEALIEQYQVDLVVPMTLLVPRYRDEILERLAYRHAVREFVLDTSAAELTRRIEGQVLLPDDPESDAEVRQWRLDRIDTCTTALAAIDTRDHISTDDRSIAAVVHEIVDRLDEDKPRRWH